MSKKRKQIPIDVRRLVLHEAGYKCANPACRGIITLDIHHMVPVVLDGKDTPENLLPLCPNCHALHHAAQIPETSIRAWKFLLLSLNEAYDRKAIDTVLALDRVGKLCVSGDGLIACVGLIASGMIEIMGEYLAASPSPILQHYVVTLTERGKQFVQGWKAGDQNESVRIPDSGGNKRNGI